MAAFMWELALWGFLQYEILYVFFIGTGMFWKIQCNRICVWYCDFDDVQYIPRNLYTVFALLCFVVIIHWLIFPYPAGLLDWHCGNLTIAPVPAKQPWWIWINTSCEFIINDCITTTKQSTTKPCAYFLGYTVWNEWNLCFRVPFYSCGLTLIPSWISNHISGKVWDEIIYSFPNFNGATVEVWEWISNFTIGMWKKNIYYKN